MSSEVKLLDLKPNPNLLDATFDGYKLSLEPISKIKFPLLVPPHKIFPSEEQYSSLHAQLFSLQNHLVHDPWAKNTMYFADSNRNIQCIKYNEQTAKLDPLTTVYRLRQCNPSPTDYNISFTFISEKYCVLTDGLGVLYLIDTGDRFTKSEWKSVYSDFGIESSLRFYVQDAKFEFNNGTKNVWCVLLHIEHVETSFETFLNLVQLKQDENGVWSKIGLKDIKLKNLPTYCSLEPRSSAIVLCTDTSINLNSTEKDETTLPRNEQEENPFPFTWTQLDDDIFIKFKLSKAQDKCDFKVNSKDQWITITYQTESLLTGKLFGEVVSDLTTWSMETERTGAKYIQVTLVKKDSSNFKWTSLLSEQDISEKIEDETEPEAQKYSLTSVLQPEMEDCDMNINDLENDYSLRKN